MSARDWFERIHAEVIECAKLESNLQDLKSQLGPKGQEFSVIGHGSVASDASAPVLRAVQAEIDYERRRAKCNAMVERALAVLYGEDGRGGLARCKGSTTADCICGYYLMGMSWREVADELARPDSLDGPQWCKRRAHRAFGFIDRYGAIRLARH